MTAMSPAMNMPPSWERRMRAMSAGGGPEGAAPGAGGGGGVEVISMIFLTVGVWTMYD